MDENDLELALINNLKIEVDVSTDTCWNMDGATQEYKTLTVNLYYKDTLISTSESSL